MKCNGYYVNQIWELLRSRTVVREGWMLHGARPQDLQRRKHILPRFEAQRSEKEARLLLPLSCRGPSLRAARGLGPTYGPHNNRCGGGERRGGRQTKVGREGKESMPQRMDTWSVGGSVRWGNIRSMAVAEGHIQKVREIGQKKKKKSCPVLCATAACHAGFGDLA